MKKSFKNKLIEFYDKENDGENPYPYVALAIITMIIAKIMNAKFIICILSASTISMALGVVIQILKKDKNIRNLIFYLLITIFLGVVTIIIYVVENGYVSNTSLYLKILFSGLAVFLDFLGGYAILANKARKVLPVIIMMIVVTLLAIGMVIFLPPIS